MLYGGKSLEWWDTPLSSGYESFFVTQGKWDNDGFVVPIECTRIENGAGERWECKIPTAIWVRVVTDEFFDCCFEIPATPRGPFRAPFYRVANSNYAPLYGKFLEETGAMRAGGSIREYLIASMENHLHFIAMEEPLFTRLAS